MEYNLKDLQWHFVDKLKLFPDEETKNVPLHKALIDAKMSELDVLTETNSIDSDTSKVLFSYIKKYLRRPNVSSLLFQENFSINEVKFLYDIGFHLEHKYGNVVFCVNTTLLNSNLTIDDIKLHQCEWMLIQGSKYDFISPLYVNEVVESIPNNIHAEIERFIRGQLYLL